LEANVRAREFALIAAILLAATVLLPRYVDAACREPRGAHVVLYGSGGDPDVLIWDSRFRLRAYESGSFDEMNALLPHALLARPGTRAVVRACLANFVESKYLVVPDDAVGIVVTAGPLRGKYGWVIGSDVRAMRARFRERRR
jgi:hypothetical protein